AVILVIEINTRKILSDFHIQGWTDQRMEAVHKVKLIDHPKRKVFDPNIFLLDGFAGSIVSEGNIICPLPRVSQFGLQGIPLPQVEADDSSGIKICFEISTDIAQGRDVNTRSNARRNLFLSKQLRGCNNCCNQQECLSSHHSYVY